MTEQAELTRTEPREKLADGEPGDGRAGAVL